MHSTGLTKAQITAWFGVERERPENEGELVDTSEVLEISPAAIWLAYNRDPIGCINSLLEARRLAEEQDRRDDEYEMEEFRHMGRLMEIDLVRLRGRTTGGTSWSYLGGRRRGNFVTGQLQPPLYMLPSSPTIPMEDARNARSEQEYYRSRSERGEEERARIRAGY